MMPCTWACEGRGRARGREQIIGTAPYGVQGIGVSLATIRSKVTGRLRLQRRNGSEATRFVGRYTGAADGVVVTVLAIAVGRAVEAVVVGDLLRPHPARVGGELAGHRTHIGRQQRAEIASVGQAVTEEHGLGIGDSPAMAGSAASAIAAAIRERIGRLLSSM
jgi:hypothetical protein